MDIRKGIGVSPGYAIGEAFVLTDEEFAIPRKEIAPKEVEAEAARFEAAAQRAIADLAVQLSKMSRRVDRNLARILQAHIGLLGDEKLRAEISDDIRRNRHSAEYAVSRTLKRKMKVLADDGPVAWVQPILQDLAETERALLRALLGDRREDLAHLAREYVIIAHDLSPARTLNLDRKKVLGLATEIGGSTSHTAIVASSLGIPAVVGVEGLARDVTTGDTVILDGSTGTIIVDPDSATLKRYQAMGRNFSVMGKKLSSELKELPAVSRDGTRVELLANIESPDDIPAALANGAEGVGLYRTEFLFLSGQGPPTEKNHIDAYRKAVNLLGRRRLVIRTLDLGADKMPVDGFAAEANPQLGTRAVRLCFARPDLFKTQLRAILKVAPLGNVQMMIPMVATVDELLRVREILASVRRDLQREDDEGAYTAPVGIMVEVPSAAMTLDLFVPHADFFSVGTNDLIAYTLAIDRTNERVAGLYQPSHPAILRMLSNIFQIGKRAGRPVSVCGEMSADVFYTLLLLGLGLRTFSVAAPTLPEIKKIIRSVTIKDAEEIAKEAVRLGDARKTAEYLKAETRKILPDAT
ncbi:MAG TPA: phosphoenolpyruvate--protein phosphotransferase [Planctomycetota bacterium]|nr:phosphoenolpyruvate--protein phosphotransferase [Planctomycetota bacterium]